MTDYIIRRLLQAILAIAVLIVVVFGVTHMLGDPVRIMVPPGASEEAVQAMRHRMGLDRPLYVQFLDYVKGIPVLNFGTSLWQGVPSTTLVLERLPATTILAMAAVGWALIAGAILGVLSALKPNGVLDRSLGFITIMGVSSVDFWVGLMLILIVAVQVGWLPTSGYGELKHLILPALALGFRPFGRIAQVTRPALIEEFNKQYILALRAKGLPEYKVAYHGIRNASVIILTLAGYEFARLFYGAAVVIETVFGWPGIGLLIVQAIMRRDWPLIVATTAIVAVIVILFHLFLDLAYGAMNPRVRFE